jgi:hypothetical protein
MAYAPIFASGHAAATLHYDANDKPLAEKLNVLVDAGAEWENYASDIVRLLRPSNPMLSTFTGHPDHPTNHHYQIDRPAHSPSPAPSLPNS